MLYISFLIFLLQYLSLFQNCYGHGYLADPPARSSAWLFDNDFSSCCQYYNHAEMFCGGINQQWLINGGKCSICGEAYDAKPKLFGLGDSQYLGKIVRTYTEGSIIPVTVVITANHRGTFEFRVCNIDNTPNEDATQECLDLNLLKTVYGSTHYHIESSYRTVNINLTLPSNFTCKHCVFQWKYITGNSWGAANGKSCVGCGDQNEEFYGCSDIAIVNNIETETKPIDPNRQCTSAVQFSRTFDLTALMSRYCQTVCSNNCIFDKIDSNSTSYDDCKNSCDKLCICK